MSMRRFGRGAALVLLVVLAGACGDDGESSDGDANKQLDHFTQKAALTVKGGGVTEIDFSGDGEIRVLKTLGETKSTTVGTASPVKLANGWSVEVFGTVGSTKDGTFEVTPGQAPAGATVTNTFYANVFKGELGKATEGGRFDKLTEPCTIKIAKGGSEGSMSCKKVGPLIGTGEVSIDFSWKANGPKMDVPMQSPSSTTSTTSLTGAP